MRKKGFFFFSLIMFFMGSNIVSAKSINELELGDYIKMTPTSSSTSISSSLTGCGGNQTINPSELNLWRVIKKNDDGTIDVISNSVSKEELSLCGEVGYRNLINSLNTIANYYKNDMFTVNARHMGYKNQTNVIVGDLYKGTLSTNQSNNNGIFETSGGGDLLYQSDYDLTNSAVGTLTAKKADGTITSYWLASRNYYANSAAGYSYGARIVGNSGAVSGSTLTFVDHGETGNNEFSYSIRPILTLKGSLLIGSGDGKGENTAYQLKPSNKEILDLIVRNFENNKNYFKTKKDYTVFSEIINGITLSAKDTKLVINSNGKEDVLVDFDGTIFNFEPNIENNYDDLNQYATADAYYTYYGLLYAIGNYRGYSNEDIYDALGKVKFSVEDISVKSVPLVGNYDTNNFSITIKANYDESAKNGNKINVAPTFKINIDNYDLKDLSVDFIDATNVVRDESTADKITRYIRETIKGEDEEGNKNNRRIYIIIGICVLIVLIILFMIFSKEKKKPKIDIESL